MDRERPTTEPLINELRTIRAELRVAIQQRQNTENEGTAQTLAARQARVLKQLMKANSRLQQRISDVLDPQQRKKLDFFKRTSEVTAADGNQRRVEKTFDEHELAVYSKDATLSFTSPGL